MVFKDYNSVSDNVKFQISSVTDIWKKHLGDSLTGIYIHGSMALHCFVEGTSDIDMLIVVSRKIPREERLAIVRDIIEADGKPCTLEMSAIYEDDLKPWRHPTICQFHYSDYHRENYKKLLSGEIDNYYIIDNDFEDTDIACHVKLAKQSGICVYGKSTDEVFPDVPEDDFLSSICDDIDNYDFDSYLPKYFCSNILTLGRILSYLKMGRILSKYEAGVWTADYVPEKFKNIVKDALEVWYNHKAPCNYNDDLDKLRLFLIGEIKECNVTSRK